MIDRVLLLSTKLKKKRKTDNTYSNKCTYPDDQVPKMWTFYWRRP